MGCGSIRAGGADGLRKELMLWKASGGVVRWRWRGSGGFEWLCCALVGEGWMMMPGPGL